MSSLVTRLRVPALVAGGYLLLAVWVVHPLWADPAGRYPATNTSDPEFFDFVLVHAARIFTHGENPLFTPMFNAPLGVNLVANTGMLALAVLFTGLLSVTLAAPTAATGAAPTSSDQYQYLENYGFYSHPAKPGYFCSRCKTPLKVHKNGWACLACGQFYKNNQPGGNLCRR